MKRNIETALAFLLIGGNILTHLWGWMPVKWQNAKFDYFIKPGFHYEMTFAYWVHDLTDSLNKVTVLFVTSMIATEISQTLFKIVFVFLLYEVADFWLLLWDYKQTKEIYWVMSVVVIMSLMVLLRRHKMKPVR